MHGFPPIHAARLSAALLVGVLLAGGVTVGPAAPAAAAGRWDAAEDYRFATGLYQKRRYDQAERALRDYVAANPSAPNVGLAKMYLGFSLGSLGKYEEARDLLREFVKESDAGNRYLRDATLRLGLYAQKAGVPREADRVLSALIDSKPKDELNEYALVPLGDARRELGDAGGAERAYRRLLADHPKSRFRGEARLNLAALLADTGRVDAAVAELNAAAADVSDPAGAEQARFQTGFVLFGAGRDEDALRAFAGLLDQYPRGAFAAEARMFAGFALYRLREDDRAAKVLREAAVDPRFTARARYWAGMSLRRMGNLPEAAADLTAAAAADPDGKFGRLALRQLAEVRAAAGDAAEARRTLEQFLARHGDAEGAAEATLRAAELAVEAEDAEAADRLLARFDTQFAGQDAGRVAELRGGQAELRYRLAPDDAADAKTAALRDAVAHYTEAQKLLTNPVAAGRAAARGAYADILLGNNESARRLVEPWITKLTPADDDAPSPVLSDLLQIAMEAAVRAGDSARVVELAGEIIARFPETPAAERAFVLAAKGKAEEGDLEGAGGLRETFKLNHPGSTAITPVTLDLADGAFASDDFGRASNLYREAVGETAPADTPELRTMRSRALSGLGWSDFRLKQFGKAAEAFGQLLSELPADPRAAEAMAMRGVALKEAGDTRAAETALRAAWVELAPDEPAPAGAENGGPGRQAWLAGLTLARLLNVGGDVDAADAAYKSVLEAFPNARQIGPMMWEWGRMLHVAERFPQADEKFARLVELDPGHPEADTALLLLGESDAIARRYDAADARFARIVDAPAAGTAPPDVLTADPQTRESAFLKRLDLADVRGDDAALRQNAERFLQDYPDGVEAARVRFLRAKSLRRAGDVASLKDARVELAVLRALRNDAAVSRAEWYPEVWVLEADAAFADKDYDAVERLAAELEAFDPPPPNLFKIRELRARVAKQRPPADLPRAQELAEQVLDDPAAKGTVAADRARLLLADVFRLRAPPDYAAARDQYLRVNIGARTAELKALGGLGAGQMDEKLGQTEAAKRSYAEVVEEYPDTDAARRASERLKSLP